MGLDMYLNAKKDIPYEVAVMLSKADNGAESWDAVFRDYLNESWMGDKATAKAGDTVNATARVGYWRKANAIHDWFVRNVQDDKDDCDEYEVSAEQLQTLIDECKRAIDVGAETENLKPTEGFFFGSTDIKYMLDDCKDTITQLEKILEEYSGWTFFYRSSW